MARYTLLVGYFNRNLKETLDIPVGPNNRIEPGGPDQGQPTHFLPRRQWGVFTIKVPKDFGDKRLTWTIVANGQTTIDPGRRDQGLSGRAVQGSRAGQRATEDSVRPEGADVFRARRLGLPRR